MSPRAAFLMDTTWPAKGFAEVCFIESVDVSGRDLLLQSWSERNH